MSRIHLSLPNAYKLMCFDRNINGNRDVKFLIGIIGHCTDQLLMSFFSAYLDPLFLLDILYFFKIVLPEKEKIHIINLWIS